MTAEANITYLMKFLNFGIKLKRFPINNTKKSKNMNSVYGLVNFIFEFTFPKLLSVHL